MGDPGAAEGRLRQVSVHMVRAVVSAVERAGGSRERFAERAGAIASQLDGHETWLSIDDYRRIIEAALEVTDDPVLGLHFGEQASSVMFQVLAHLVEHSATLGDVLDTIVHYTELLAPGFKPRVMCHDERVALRFPWLSGDQPMVRVMAELAMAGLLRLLRQYVGEPAGALRVSFAYPEPERADEYRRVFGGRERFAQPFTELQFPRSWLSRTQLHSNPELHQLLKLQADRQLALQRRQELSARVERLLAAKDPRALPSMPAVARALGLSTRTLTRRLQAEEVTFAELIVKRRRRAAQEFLRLGVLSVQEVSQAMGFADPTAFHKAFKRWTGSTPRQYATSIESARR